jgi:hypothetical protein
MQDRYKRGKIMVITLQRYARRAPDAPVIPGTADSQGTTTRIPATPVMGPADDPTAIPVMGPADSATAIPVMGPSGTRAATPVMGAGVPAAVSLLGPADSPTAVPLMSPRR